MKKLGGGADAKGACNAEPETRVPGRAPSVSLPGLSLWAPAPRSFNAVTRKPVAFVQWPRSARKDRRPEPPRSGCDAPGDQEHTLSRPRSLTCSPDTGTDAAEGPSGRRLSWRTPHSRPPGQPGLCSLRPPHASPSGRVRAVTKRARPGPGCRDPRARDTRATCLAWPPGRARRRGCRAGPGPQRPGCAGWQSPSLEQRPTRAWPLRKAPRNPVFHCAGSSRPQQVPWPAPPPAAGRPPLLGHLGSEMLPPRAHHPDPRPVAHWPPATSLSKEPFE